MKKFFTCRSESLCYCCRIAGIVLSWWIIRQTPCFTHYLPHCLPTLGVIHHVYRSIPPIASRFQKQCNHSGSLHLAGQHLQHLSRQSCSLRWAWVDEGNSSILEFMQHHDSGGVFRPLWLLCYSCMRANAVWPRKCGMTISHSITVCTRSTGKTCIMRKGAAAYQDPDWMITASGSVRSSTKSVNLYPLPFSAVMTCMMVLEDFFCMQSLFDALSVWNLWWPLHLNCMPVKMVH